MAERNSSTPVECLIFSIPCSFLQSYSEELRSDDEICISGLGPNTIIVNDKTATNLKVKLKDRCTVFWIVLKICFDLLESDNKMNSFKSERLIQVIIDNRVGDDLVVVSEDFLFNLEYSSGLRNSCCISSLTKPNKLNLSCERQCANSPIKATKVILAMIQLEINPEDIVIDKLLQSYFSCPRYLCKNDVFGVHISDNNKFGSPCSANIDTVYFKVCEIEGVQSFKVDVPNDICQGFFVDSSITIYQVSNYQDLHPARRITFNNALKPSLGDLLDSHKLMDSLDLRGHDLIPVYFDKTFNILCKWMEPFLCGFKKLQDVELTPIFIISGPNGSGKTLLVEALGRYFGMNYWRVDCAMLGEPVPGQAEARLKALFNKLNTISPCILHLSNLQALFEDADGKDDVRVLSCFEQQIKSLKLKWPVVIIASTSNLTSMSSNVNQLFLESLTLNPPNQAEREDILAWYIDCNHGVIDKQILQAVAAQTSGFILRDLEMLVSLAFKEKYYRVKEENLSDGEFAFSDFSKIIGTMRKVFSESIGAPKVPSVSWKDVGGLEHLKKEILRSLRSNTFNTGLKRSGLMLHGPPGTGKTLLAKAVATQCGRNFLSVKGPELLNMYVGQSEQNVRDLFEMAKSASPCIIFFDELDSLAPNRGRSGDSGGVMDRVVSQLLAEMDTLSSSGDVFILGATNRPDLIDPALLRPGRLDKLLYIGPCADRASQLSVLTALTRKLTLASDVNLEQLVSTLPARVSGAQLSALCSAAWLASARQTIQGGSYKQNPTVVVNQTHFLDALRSTLS